VAPPVTDGRSPAWNRDLLISATVHRHVLAQKAVAAARAQLAECDADAKSAGVDLRTLRRASQKAEMTPADHRLEQDADAYVHRMRTVAFGACSEPSEAGAFLPTRGTRTVTPDNDGDHT
jgi:hypothetical protein